MGVSYIELPIVEWIFGVVGYRGYICVSRYWPTRGVFLCPYITLSSVDLISATIRLLCRPRCITKILWVKITSLIGLFVPWAELDLRNRRSSSSRNWFFILGQHNIFSFKDLIRVTIGTDLKPCNGYRGDSMSHWAGPLLPVERAHGASSGGDCNVQGYWLTPAVLTVGSVLYVSSHTGVYRLFRSWMRELNTTRHTPCYNKYTYWYVNSYTIPLGYF